MLEEADARIAFAEVPRQRERAIRRPVVDEEELPVGEALREDALHRLGHEALGVEEREEDGDAGHGGRATQAQLPTSGQRLATCAMSLLSLTAQATMT